jgi:hypothetical protein
MGGAEDSLNKPNHARESAARNRCGYASIHFGICWRRTPLETRLDCMADRLNSGGQLQLNESLGSASAEFSLVLQQDGNLVLYDQQSQPVWASGTEGQSVSAARMQEDGNFVLYTSTDEPVWATDTYGNEGAYLVLQDDRNLVLHGADGNPLWATNTPL